MKTKVTKIICLLTMCFVIVAVSIGVSVAAKDSTLLFEDDFSNASLSGWKNSSVGSVSEGVYALGQDSFNAVTAVGEQADSIVTADVSINIGKDSNNARQGGVAMLAVRTNAEGTEGYEFGLGISKSGSGYLRLYRRGNGDKGLILFQRSSEIPGVDTIKRNTTYNLKIAVLGERILCYINGELFADVTDNTYQSGQVGLHTDGAKGSFDNVKVQSVPKQEVEKITILSHSDTVSVTGKVYVEIDVAYNSIYGTEQLNQDSEGVTLTGLNGKTGDKIMTVSYGGKEVTFPLTVTKTFTSEVWHNETFSDNLASYSDGTHANEEYNYSYNFGIKNGKGVVNAVKTNGANLPAVVTLTPAKDKMSTWKMPYSVKTDVAITGDAYTSTFREGQAGLSVAKRSSDDTEYVFRVTNSGNLLIYRGSSEQLFSANASLYGITFATGTKLTLRADVYEDHTEFYCNDKLITIINEISVDNATPYTRLTSYNGSCWFDNWTVKSLETKGSHAVKSFKVVSSSTLEEWSNIKACQLVLDELMLKVTYTDGTTGLVAINESMLSSYSKTSTKQQTITVNYAGKKQTIFYTHMPYLFYDDFSAGYNSQWKFTTSGGLVTYGVEDGKLSVKYPTGESTSSGLLGRIMGGDDWSNYSISADVYFDSRTSVLGQTRAATLTARRNPETTYCYSFSLKYSGSLTAELKRYSSDGTTTLKSYNVSQLAECMGTKERGLGVEYNMKLEVRGNIIKCYIDNVLLPVYVDDSEYAVTNGLAAIGASCNTVTFDNVIVQKKMAQNIAELRLSGTHNNVVELYEGFDIDIPSYKLQLVDKDGTYDEISLTPDMVSDFDNTALGKQKITITYLDFSYPATVNILERPEELDAFAKAVKKVKIKNAAKEEGIIDTLREQHDSFSPYELSKLDDEILEHYEKLLEALERAKDKNLQGLDLLWADSLNEVTADTWNASLEGNGAKWFHLNGTLYQAQRPYNIQANGMHSPNIYGEIYSISADMIMLSQDMHMGIALNISEDGYYYVRVSNKGRDSYNEVSYTLELRQKGPNGHVALSSVALLEQDIHLEMNKKFNLRLTYKDGIIIAYVDGDAALKYDASAEYKQYRIGECGLRVTEGDGIYDNVRIYGKEVERPVKESDPIEPTYYNDNFDDETKGSSPSHWVENSEFSSVTDNWKVYDKGGSRVYGTTVTSELTETWLHVFEKDPEFTMKFMVDAVSKTGRIGFITRRSPDTAFVNIGYDFKESKWYIASQESEAAGCVMLWAEKASNLKKNEWYTARVETDGSTVTVYINNKKVVESKGVARTGFGRLGFFTNGASLYVDDLKCTFKNGDIPQDGVISYVIEPEKYSHFMEIESPDDGTTLIGIGSTRKLSTNAGLTWTDVTKDEKWTGLPINGYQATLKLHDGRYMQIVGNDEYAVKVSSNLNTWETIGRAVPEEDMLSDTGLISPTMHINSLTEFEIADGKWRLFMPMGFRRYNQAGSVIGHYTKIYYSDDGGKTWMCSETTTKDILPGYTENGSTTWCESKIIQCSDGTLRMYYSRNYLGCMAYTESKDGGVTWSGLYQIPYMQNPMTSFAVIADPTEPGTYYMIWLNATPTHMSAITPRVRPCLLKSTDGKNWQFLMNCEYMSTYYSVTNGAHLYQILDPSLYVTEDYVYITFGRSERERYTDVQTAHEDQRTYYIRVEKDKLQTRAWNASTVSDMNYPKTIEFETLPQTTFGQGDLFNIYGGKLKLTALNGKVTYEDITENCNVYIEPNMMKLGKTTIPIYWKNGYELTYDVTVVPNHRITWKVSDGGSVEPKKTKVMAGGTLEVKLVPDQGYTIDYVLVNDEDVSVINRTLKVEDVKDNLKIEVVFRELTILDYLLWIVGGIVILAAIGGTVFVLIRRKKTIAGVSGSDEIMSLEATIEEALEKTLEETLSEPEE